MKTLYILPLSLSLLSCQATTEPKQLDSLSSINSTTVEGGIKEPKISQRYPMSTQSVLNKHLKIWKKTNISDYQYQFQRSCFCTPEYTKAVSVSVSNNKVIGAHFIDNGRALPRNIKNRKTINDLFNIIQEAINQKAYNINVKYNSNYGYPISISIDYKKNMADDELYINISHFKKTV